MLILYILIDILCAGAGMGVPIFCILLGFISGWIIVGKILSRTDDFYQILTTSIKYGIVTALVTFFIMLIIWGRAILLLFNHSYDFNTFGHPLILYDPKISFIGWIGLMIVISPLLQLLTTVFSFYIALIIIKKKETTE